MEPQNTRTTLMDSGDSGGNLLTEPRAMPEYLQASGLRLCLPPNFGKPRPEMKRVILALYGTPAVRVFCGSIQQLTTYASRFGSRLHRPKRTFDKLTRGAHFKQSNGL